MRVRTVEAVTAALTQMGVRDVDLHRNFHAGNMAMDAIRIAALHGVAAPRRVVVSARRPLRAGALYSPSNDAIWIAHDVRLQSWRKALEHSVATGWLSQGNPALHEMGHKAHADHAGERYDQARNHWFTPAEKAAAGSVSRYALTNGNEYVAEALSAKWAGRRLSAEAESLLTLLFR